MTPKIPPRNPDNLWDDIRMINELYFRWSTNQLLPTDTLLIMQHQERLETMRARAEWEEQFRMDHLNWKVDQMNLKPSEDKEID